MLNVPYHFAGKDTSIVYIQKLSKMFISDHAYHLLLRGRVD